MFWISAFKRTEVLFSAMLMMAVLWGFIRIPGANLQMIVFAFLASSLLVENRFFSARLRDAVIWACYCAAVQFLISVTCEIPLLQTLLTSVLVYFVFRTLPDHRTGCMVMLVGYLALFAPTGWEEAVSRSMDIFVGILVVMAVTSLWNAGLERKEITTVSMKYTPYQAAMLAAELGVGMLIFRILDLAQGPWVMLTVIFIRMSETPGVSTAKLALQRIFAVPLGIIAGGFLLETFCRVDERFIYLIPLIGASGFFMLYENGDFFLFTLIFMITLTMFSNWMAGPYQRFDFWEIFFARTVAALLGASLELLLHPFPGTKLNI